MSERDKPALPPELAARIAEQLAPAPLDPERREALQARLMERCQRPGTAVLRADEGEWVETFAGIRVKTLRRDPVSRTQTTLWRIAPGARVPRHTHSQAEAGPAHLACLEARRLPVLVQRRWPSVRPHHHSAARSR